jgi:hypothetical protein
LCIPNSKGKNKIGILTVAFFLTFIVSYLHVKGSGAKLFCSFAFSFEAAVFAFNKEEACSY